MTEQIKSWLAQNQDAILAELAELVAIPSVSESLEGAHPFGEACTQALETALQIGERHGLKGRNMENYCGYARLEVNDDSADFGLIAHLDVVPPLDGWLGDPFQMQIRDGWAIGRGVMDNKGAAIASYWALEYLRQHSHPRHNWRVFLGLNEERGMRDLAYYLEHQPAPALSLVPDAVFPVCYAEKSHLNVRIALDLSETNIVSIEAGTVPNIVPAAAKAVIADLKAYEANPQDLAGLPTRTMEAEGRSKHASMPDGSLNAVGVLARKLLDEGLVNPAGRKLLELLESLANDIHGELTGTARDDEALGNTSQVGSIARTEGRTLYYTFDTRFPAIAKADEIAEDLQRFYDPQGISFEVLRKDDAIPQDPKAPLIGALTRIVNEELGTDLKPYTMGGGTYARKLPNAYAFGLEQDGQQPPSFLPDGQGGVHQPNEALNIAGYMQGIAILIKAMLWLDENID